MRAAHVVGAAHVQVGLLLAGEGGGLGVLGAGARAHGDGHVALAEPGVGVEHRAAQRRVQLDGADQLLRGRPRPRARGRARAAPRRRRAAPRRARPPGTTKPGGTGRPKPVMRASDAPLPPACTTSRQRLVGEGRTPAHSSITATARTGAAVVPDPLDRQHAQLEAVRAADLLEVHQVLEVPVLLVPHHAVGLPEQLLLEHRPHRRVEGDRVAAHQPHALRDQPARRLGAHARVVGAVALLGVVGARPGVVEHDVALLELVLDAVQLALHVVRGDDVARAPCR